MIPGLLAALVCAGDPAAFGTTKFPYRSEAFTQFVADSYRVNGKTNPNGFYAWFEGASATFVPGGVRSYVDRTSQGLKQAREPDERASKEQALAADLHRIVKRTIPKFSLDRGFEFVHTVGRGERQCFLQSVLVAGLLQRAGMDAGVAMVWRNTKNEESNNGHAVALTKLANGRMLIVDCSEPAPFPKMSGLFVATPDGYRFAYPVYKGLTPYVIGFQSTRDRSLRAMGLDRNFLNSQFNYYRGERAPGGFMTPPRTAAGLASSQRFLEQAVRDCPENPLAEYVLGHVYSRQGKPAEATRQYRKALAIYQRQGWVPGNVAAAAR